MGPGLAEPRAAVAAQGIAAVARVKPSELPATMVARTVYHGGYEGLGNAWREFDAWIAACGHPPGPESSPDPDTWRTELSRPLIDS